MMLENGLVLPQPSERECFHRDSEDDVRACGDCDLPRSDSEMSPIDGICNSCYAAALKSLQKLVEAQNDSTMLAVFNYITED